MLTKYNDVFQLIGIRYSLFSLLFFASTTFLVLSFSDVRAALSFFEYMKLLLIGSVAFFVIRSVGMIMNQIIDRAIDYKNVRTRCRVLPQQRISLRLAKCFVWFGSLLFVCLSFYLNFICAILGLVALTIITIYPYTKRFTYLCHWILGSIYYLAVLMIGFVLFPTVSAQRFCMISLFGGSIALIISANDIIYAIQDIDFDRSEKLFSIPCFFERRQVVRIAQICLILSAMCYIFVGLIARLGMLFYISGIFVDCAYLYTIYNYKKALIKDNKEIMRVFFYGNINLALAFLINTSSVFLFS